MEGIINNEVIKAKAKKGKSLVDSIKEDTAFVVDPMPNLYFTRDPFASIGNGVSLNRMYSVTRNRETIYAEYILFRIIPLPALAKGSLVKYKLGIGSARKSDSSL